MNEDGTVLSETEL